MSASPAPFPLRGELAALVGSRDWSGSPLGPPDSWPASLRTVLRVMLTSRYAMWLGWGPELVMFYNDAYREQTLGAKHPWALGRSASEVWAEIWDTIGPRVDHVLRTGEATWDEGLLLFLERSGYPEETYHTFSYSPLPGDDGRIAGLFCVVIEETERVIADRRMAVLGDLAAAMSQTNTRSEVIGAAERLLASKAHTFPFSVLYLFDEPDAARRVASTHLPAGHSGTPAAVALGDPLAPWPLRRVLADAKPIEVPLDPRVEWPAGPWPKAPSRAMVLPIAQQGDARPTGALVVGLNPHRPLDEGYRSFLALFVGQLAAGLASARAYEAEKQRAEALAEIDRAKTAFFSNVSHEFRTPLTLMLGPTEDALASPERTLRGHELEIVHRNELRLLQLVNTLLDFSRIEAGRVQASYEEVDLAAFTAELASVFRSAVERVGLRLVVDAPEPLAAFVDRDMWEKIVLNLLSNALKFTFEGEIEVSLRSHEASAVLRVRDTGTGIPPTELEHLFERFHRVQGARSRSHEGSGIGLALVSELAKLHGGAAEVESAHGEGSTFVVRVPLGADHLPRDRVVATRSASGSFQRAASFVQEALRWGGDTSPDSAPPARGGALPATDERARIVLADDNADMRDYVARLLREHWDVSTFADGAEALAALQVGRADLVISDVMMPRLDGVELVRAIRADPRIAATPVMLLSARAGDEAVADGLRGGADAYLVKPFSASALLVRVEAQLAAARGRAALQRHAEAERARLRAIFDVSPAALAILRGPNLVLELANPNTLSIFGRGEEIVGRPLLDGVPELEGQGFDVLLREVLATGVARRGTAVLARLDRQRDGKLVDVFFDFVFAPMLDGDGTVDGALVHAFEVTELVLQRRAAEKANRMKDEFLATMSHELRTPLNAILGWASLLRTQSFGEAARAKALETIERNARAQARLIEDVLDVSRIVSGNLRLSILPVDVASVANAALDVVRPATAAKGITLRADIAPDTGTLAGDADRLQQVVWNLLINAVRFTPPGGTIELVTRRSASGLDILVRDTGLGIPADHVAHVFERFRQVDSSTTRKHGGLGLGLAIVRHIVELHGGTVSADSAGLDRGATFTVSLPVRAEIGGASAGRVAHAGTDGVAPRELGGLRVVIVDDDEDSRDLVASALTAAGAEVLATTDSAGSGYQAVLELRPDLLVSDIAMPGEDGYGLIRRIRSLPASHQARDVRAVALTAYARGEDLRLALAAGYDQHVAKPIDPPTLVAAVASVAARP